MQHLVAGGANVVGSMTFDAALPRPHRRDLFFEVGTLTPENKQPKQEFIGMWRR